MFMYQFSTKLNDNNNENNNNNTACVLHSAEGMGPIDCNYSLHWLKFILLPFI